GSMLVDADGHSISEGMTGRIRASDGSSQSIDRRDLDLDMFHPFRRHGDNLPINQLGPPAPVLRGGPRQVFSHREHGIGILGYDLPINQLGTLPLRLGASPSEIFGHGHWLAERDVHTNTITRATPARHLLYGLRWRALIPHWNLRHRLLEVLIHLVEEPGRRQPLLVGADQDREVLGHEASFD